MKSAIGRIRRLTAVVAMACAIPAGYAQSFSWTTIVNNADIAPGTTVNFFSYNQPAVNAAGQVVFRARAKPVMGVGELALDAAAEMEMMVSGVFRRDMSTLGPISALVKRGDIVPPPNNTLTNGVLADFTEFPSTPRIDASSALVATRGQSKPVYSYIIDDIGSETRVGTSGVYADAGGGLVTGVGLLGAVRDFATGTLTFPYFSVPGAPEGTRFDQFPGSPAVADGSKIAWKGNYTDPTDGLGRTGVYFRDLLANGGTSPVTLIANSNMLIPNQPAGGTVKFGSTAPPSAANGYVVFTGLDNEDAPTLGGIYRAPLMSEPPLQVLVGIGDPVPGESGATFNRFGEGLSISANGRYVSFWGAWGTETTPKVLHCINDGNKERVAYCNETHEPAGYTAQIPVHQGIFVADAQSGQIIPIAKTGEDGITDFVYWVYSGAPPGVGNPGEESGDESKEPPRWRSSAFSALAGKQGEYYGTTDAPSPFQVAFKATRNGYDGIYLRKGRSSAPLQTVVENSILTPGDSIDPQAPTGSLVTAVGVERDGFRHENLAVTVAMLYETVDTSIGWGGLYLTKSPALTHGKLETASATLEFGSVPIATSSAAKTVVLTNVGQLPATVTSVALSGGDFALAGNTCTGDVAAGATCEISALFTPSIFGPRHATLSVNGSAVTVVLNGNGDFGTSVKANITGVIAGYYEHLLGRAPDSEGMAYWLGEIDRMAALGVDTKEVFFALGRQMLNSPEYLARNTSDEQFIMDMYEAFLMRAPDAEGVAYWLGQIALGLDRRVIVSAFMFSDEFVGHMQKVFGAASSTRPEFNAVVDLYRGFLNRLPDTLGFNYWLLQWQHAQCAGPAAVAAVAEQMSLQFINSAEFAARWAAEPAETRAAMIIASFYDTFMRRGADAQGFNFWVNALKNGTATLDEIRKAFIASPEFQQLRIAGICAAGCVR